MKVKHFKENLRYKLFKIWKAQQYRKFLREENYEFDWSSIVNMLILKLTMMGLQFRKFGWTSDEDVRLKVNTIWATRRELKRVLNAFNVCHDQAEKAFEKRFGFPYRSEMISTPCEDHPGMSEVHFKTILPYGSPPELEEEANKVWRELFPFDADTRLANASLKTAFKLMQKHIWNWWD